MWCCPRSEVNGAVELVANGAYGRIQAKVTRLVAIINSFKTKCR